MHYTSCINVVLDCQIGNYHFVTSSNAAKAVFLKDTAVEFLKFTGRDKGNKLERDVYLKLHDCNELAALKGDGLMFYHVYADPSKIRQVKKFCFGYEHSLC